MIKIVETSNYGTNPTNLHAPQDSDPQYRLLHAQTKSGVRLSLGHQKISIMEKPDALKKLLKGTPADQIEFFCWVTLIRYDQQHYSPEELGLS